MSFAIRIKNLNKQFGNITALNDMSADIPASCVVSIVGPDSSGKTTLMRLLAGLMQPTHGLIEIFGKNRRQITNLDNFIGYMPQKFGLYEDLSVMDNLNLHAELKHIPLEERHDIFNTLLKFTSLMPFTSRLTGRLSGGMKQKLGLACALLGSPKLLLLDEPGVGVDPISRRELWNMVQQLSTDGMSILWATAYMDEAAQSAHVLMLSDGELLYNGKPDEWIASIANRTFFDNPPRNAPAMWARESLVKWTEDKRTLDALVQGSKVRILFSEDVDIPKDLSPAKPCLEDAYMNIVGGIDKKPSVYHTFSFFPSQADSLSGQMHNNIERFHLPNPPAKGFNPFANLKYPHFFKQRLKKILMRGLGGNHFPRKNREKVLCVCPDSFVSSQAEEITNSVPVVEAQGLYKYFGDFAATHDVNFTVSRGQIFGLLGPNGAGKSTTFRMLCGLLQPSAGKCLINGINMQENPEKARSSLGYMAQNFSLYGDLTVWQNICFIARMYNIDSEIFEKRSSDLIKNLDLEKFKNVSTSTLSLGQKQRLSLLCATLHAPKVLFLDEPTSGVDPRTRREFWKHIQALTQQGVAVIVTTHFMEEAEYCDEIVLISHGKIIAQGCPDEIKQSQKNSKNPDPSLEDAFIAYLEQDEKKLIEKAEIIQNDNTLQNNLISKKDTKAKIIHGDKAKKTPAYGNKFINNKKLYVNKWWRVVFALVYKESKQIIRDPSSYLIAFILPFIFLMFFGFAISFDTGIMKLAVLAESQGKYSQSLILDIAQSPNFNMQVIYNRKHGEYLLIEQKAHAIFVIPEDFDKKIELNQEVKIQLIIDATEPNNAKQVEIYTESIINQWFTRIKHDQGVEVKSPIIAQMNVWYNNTANSRWALIPGSITVIMTMIGTLLTSLVITREWERGSMEMLFASPISRMQIFISKFIPYYVLAMFSMGLCTLAGVYIFGVPYRGSIFALFILSTAFLLPALGQGFLISSTFKSQFPAAMLGFITGLLPALILSGLLFDIQSMPLVLQYITLLVPARYFLVALQTAFLTGDLWEMYLPAIAYMSILGFLFLYKAYSNLTKNLDE